MFKHFRVTKAIKRLEVRGPSSAIEREQAAKLLGEIGGRRAIEPLVDAINGNNTRDTRNAAAEALGKIGGHRAIELLVDGINDSDYPETRNGAAEALGKIGHPDAIEPLAAMLRECLNEEAAGALQALDWNPSGSEDKLRLAIGLRDRSALVELADSAGPLLTLVDDSDHRIKWNYLIGEAKQWVMTCLPDFRPSFRNSLLELLDKEDSSEMTMTVINCLAKLREERAAPGLLARLDDSNYLTRGLAARALREIVIPEAAEPLRKLLQDPEDFVRGDAAPALVSYPSPETVAALVKAIRKWDKYEKPLSYRHMFETLGSFGMDAVPALLEFVKSDRESVFKPAVEATSSALQRPADPRYADALFETMRFAEFHDLSCMALAGIGEPMVEKLIGMLKHSDPCDRACAAKILGKIGDARAIEPLALLLEDDGVAEFLRKRNWGWNSMTVEEAARNALRNLNDPRATEANESDSSSKEPEVQSVGGVLAQIPSRTIRGRLKFDTLETCDLVLNQLNTVLQSNADKVPESELRQIAELNDAQVWQLGYRSECAVQSEVKKKVSFQALRQMAKQELARRENQ